MAIDDQDEGGGGNLGFWQSLPPNRRIMVVIAAVGILAIIVFLAVMGRGSGEDKYVTVYSKLSPKDVGETVTVLKEMKLDHKVVQDGSAIAIERSKVDEARIGLAMRGLPKDGVVGYEIFDKGSFISTDFEKRVSLQRAVNGEMSRLIRKFDGVQDARVTVVMPEQALFAEQQQPPTAAVMINFAPGGGFRPESIEAITHLIASSVQGLKPDNVTVVDNAGNMLASGQGSADKAGERGLAKEMTRRLELQRDMENDLETRATQLLEKVVGPGKAKVRVALEMNWDRNQSRARRMRPVMVDGTTPMPIAKRQSVQVNKSGGGQSAALAGAGGAPGTGSNNPVIANYQGTMQADASDAITYAGTSNVQETYNFDNEETLTTGQYGRIDRMTVAALVQVNQDTQNITQEQLSKIVKAAVGEDPERKDMVTVELVNFDTTVVDKLREEMEKAARERNPILWAVLIGLAGAVVGGGVAYAIAGRKKPPPAGADQFGGLAAAGPGMGGLAAIPAGAAPIPGAVPGPPGLAPGGMPAEMPQDRVEISRAPAAPPVADHPFAFLHNVGAETVAQLLQSERLPTLVAVLAQLDPTQTDRVIELLSPDIRREVEQRLEQNPVLPPMTQKMVSQSLKKRLSTLTSGVS